MAHYYAGKECVDPQGIAQWCRAANPPIPTPWFGKAGSFLLPLGERPGRGWILLYKTDLDDIDQTTDHSLVWSGSTTSYRRTLTNITLIRSECIDPGSATDTRAVYLCEVVDRRYLLSRIRVDKAYNLRKPDGSDQYLAGTLNSGVAWTWQQIVTDLATDLGIAPLTLPFTPQGTPESLSYWGNNFAWSALCNVLDRIACSIEYNPETNTFAIVRLGSTDSTFATAQTSLNAVRTWDDYASEPVRGWRPETVTVLFNRYPPPTGGTSPVYAVDITLDAEDGVESGTSVILEDDRIARGATGAPSNAADLATRAQERADDWLRKREGYDRRLVRVYRDFQAGNNLLGSQIAEVFYGDRGGPFATGIRSEPDYRLEKWKPQTGQTLPYGVDPTNTTDCSNCGWIFALRDNSDCLVASIASATGACDCDDTNADISLLSAGSGIWNSGESVFTICGIEYLVTFDRAANQVTLTANMSGGAVFTSTAVCCGCNFAKYTFSDPDLCTDTFDETAGPCGNLLEVTIRWEACPASVTVCDTCVVPTRLCLAVTWGGGGAAPCDMDITWTLTYRGIAGSPGSEYHCWQGHQYFASDSAWLLATMTVPVTTPSPCAFALTLKTYAFEPSLTDCNSTTGGTCISFANDAVVCSPLEFTFTASSSTAPCPCGTVTVTGYTATVVPFDVAGACGSGGGTVTGCCSGDTLPNDGYILAYGPSLTGNCDGTDFPAAALANTGSGTWATSGGPFGGANATLACAAGTWTATVGAINGTFVQVVCPSVDPYKRCIVIFNFVFTGTPCTGNAKLYFVLDPVP